MANTIAEIIWVTLLLHDLHSLPPDRATLVCDTTPHSPSSLSRNPSWSRGGMSGGRGRGRRPLTAKFVGKTGTMQTNSFSVFY